MDVGNRDATKQIYFHAVHARGIIVLIAAFTCRTGLRQSPHPHTPGCLHQCHVLSWTVATVAIYERMHDTCSQIKEVQAPDHT
jgi:hypothetical protein